MNSPVDIVIEDDRWTDLDIISMRAARAVWAALGIPAQEFCILACDDSRIAALNADFRGKPQPTNVLSWPAEERAADMPGATPHLPGTPDEIGDIAIAYDTCAREAETAGRPFHDHVTHLIVHGILHLLGYDHVEDEDADLMEALEIKILASLDLPNPYEEGQEN